MALSVDFLPGYVWGRAAALGTPTASVVAATFGVFEPGHDRRRLRGGGCHGWP